jgi:hypothetical protein
MYVLKKGRGRYCGRIPRGGRKNERMCLCWQLFRVLLDEGRECHTGPLLLLTNSGQVSGQEVLTLEEPYTEAPFPFPSNEGFYASGVLGIRLLAEVGRASLPGVHIR